MQISSGELSGLEDAGGTQRKLNGSGQEVWNKQWNSAREPWQRRDETLGKNNKNNKGKLSSWTLKSKSHGWDNLRSQLGSCFSECLQDLTCSKIALDSCSQHPCIQPSFFSLAQASNFSWPASRKCHCAHIANANAWPLLTGHKVGMKQIKQEMRQDQFPRDVPRLIILSLGTEGQQNVLQEKTQGCKLLSTTLRKGSLQWVSLCATRYFKGKTLLLTRV